MATGRGQVVGGWGVGGDVNTIIRYLLEETSKYENNYSHYLYTYGSDARLFNTNTSTLDDLGREVKSVQTCISARLSQIEQSNSAYRMLLSQELSQFTDTICEKMSTLEKLVKLQQTGTANSEVVTAIDPVAPSSNMFNHIPNVTEWREVVDQWENGCPSKNLMIPLKQWPRGTRTESLKFKYHDRRLIAMEYVNLGNDLFVSKYNPDKISMKELKKKIRESQSSVVTSLPVTNEAN